MQVHLHMHMHMHSNTTYSNRALAKIVAKGNMRPRIQSTCTTNNLRWWTPSTVHQAPACPNNRRCDKRPVREHHEKQQTWVGPGDLESRRKWSPAAWVLESHRTCMCGNISRDDERDPPRRHLYVLRLQETREKSTTRPKTCVNETQWHINLQPKSCSQNLTIGVTP